jgi:hypothetical protein
MHASVGFGVVSGYHRSFLKRSQNSAEVAAIDAKLLCDLGGGEFLPGSQRQQDLLTRARRRPGFRPQVGCADMLVEELDESMRR